MTASPVLAPLMEVRGVRHVALLSGTGEVLDSVGAAPDVGVVEAGRAVAASLVGALGGELQDLLLDLDGGPVLLTPHGEGTLMTGFDDVANLGRVRFAVRRLLQGLSTRI